MRKLQSLAAAGFLLYLIAAAAGYKALLDYALTPGRAAHAPARWPQASRLMRNRSGPTLIVAMHPHCPCSSATLAELASVVSEQSERARWRPLRVYLLFVDPPGVPDGWDRTELWQRAAAIAGITVVQDRSGREAALFGAATSGQTLLYDRAGVLRFSGGITAARGHYGDNAGVRTVAELLDNSAGRLEHTAVYGCPLFSPGRAGCRR